MTIMQLSPRFIVPALAVLLGACGGAAATADPLGPVPIESRLFQGNDGGIRDSMAVAIREPAAYAEMFGRATSMQSATVEPPPVDFSREMVLVVAGGRMSPADEIHVDSAGVRRESTPAGSEEVLAVVFTITKGCISFNRDAYPVEMVTVRRYDGPVRFIGQQRAAANCR
jgi:hypothetical protein